LGDALAYGGILTSFGLRVKEGGEARSSQAMVEFSEFICEQGLIDIPLVGGRSVWSNCRAWSRIDQFLLST
jgi:hypothetical protein